MNLVWCFSDRDVCVIALSLAFDHSLVFFIFIFISSEGGGVLFTIRRSRIPRNRHTAHTALQSRSTLVAPAHTPQFLHRLRACISLIPHHEPVPAEDVR